MTRWKWQNRQKFDKDKRRPISSRHCLAKSGLLGISDITSSVTDRLWSTSGKAGPLAPQLRLHCLLTLWISHQKPLKFDLMLPSLDNHSPIGGVNCPYRVSCRQFTNFQSSMREPLELFSCEQAESCLCYQQPPMLKDVEKCCKRRTIFYDCLLYTSPSPRD